MWHFQKQAAVHDVTRRQIGNIAAFQLFHIDMRKDWNKIKFAFQKVLRAFIYK